MLAHLSSTLLYGAPACDVCTGRLRRFGSPAALRYMRLARELLKGPLPLMALAEGAVISAQLQRQLGVVVTSCPALALYLDGTTYLDEQRDSESPGPKRWTVLVTRA